MDIQEVLATKVRLDKQHIIDFPYKKTCVFTDPHWGARSNDVLHLADLIEYIDWIITVVKENDCDSIFMLGDWFDNRNTTNNLVLSASNIGINKLLGLNIPIIMIGGNHDCYFKYNRSSITTEVYNNHHNIMVVSEPVVLSKINHAVIPYLFHHEYDEILPTLTDSKVWWGHFEFNGFRVTNYASEMKGGLDPSVVKKGITVFSGHFHQRQSKDNIHYIGNAFPTSFNDVHDSKRGCMIYDHTTNQHNYIDWKGAPYFMYTKLSEIAERGLDNLPTKTRVRCLLDVDHNVSDLSEIASTIKQNPNIREFSWEEMIEECNEHDNNEVTIDQSGDIIQTEEAVVNLLEKVESQKVDAELLVSIYKGL